MIKGVDFNFGAETLIVPPLSLGAIERFQDKLEDAASLTGSDIVDIALAALKRNYPEMERERVAELIDVENCQRVIEAVMGAAVMLPAPRQSRKRA